MGFFKSDLIAQCRANNRKAQLQLYRKYCDGMYAVAMRFMGNSADAEDILQEAFLNAFQKIEQYRGEVTFGAWLKRIVVNKCLDVLKRRKQHFEELEEHKLTVEQEQDWTVNRDVAIQEVKQAMHLLPEKYKYVVQLYLLEGYDHSEIAEILELKETTCRTRLLRGKGYLKELLKDSSYVTGS